MAFLFRNKSKRLIRIAVLIQTQLEDTVSKNDHLLGAKVFRKGTDIFLLRKSRAL